MGKKSIRKNYLYNVSYQILLILTPVITAPYLSRVLGADKVGIASAAEADVSYFVLAATFGIAIFGQREISYVQDDRKTRSRVFWETKLLQVLTSLLMLVVYIPFALRQENRILYLILIMNLLAVTASVTWFFQGMEEFGKIVIRNMICKLLSIVYIFAFVKSRSDLPLYVFGHSFFALVGDVSLWLYLPKFIDGPRWKALRPWKNLKEITLLFIPSIAIQVYTVMDKTMIKVITRDAFENGYYEQALKISKMTLTIVTSLGTVMIPRIGYHYGRGETELVRSYMYRGYRFVWFMGVPLSFGLLGVSSGFVPWYFGPGFEKVIPLLSILGFLVLAIGINNVTGMQYLIPIGRQNTFTLTVCIGAAVNFCMNALLIPRLASIGAAIASVAAETVIALVQLYIVRRELSFGKILCSSWKYLIAGSVMLSLVAVIGRWIRTPVLGTLIQAGSGAAVYFGMLLVMRDSFLLENARKVLGRLRSRLH